MFFEMDEMEKGIRECIASARQAEAEGGWITYLIRDPRRADKKGNPAGWPVYVGQTEEFGKRVRNHLRKSERLARAGTGIKARVKALLHAGVVPNFEVIDRQPTRLKSLLSETNLARLCRSRGYDIANATTLQNHAGPPITERDLPSKWFWNFTLDQALEDGLQVELICSACQTSIAFDLKAFQALQNSPKTLREIRDWPMWLEEPCGACAQQGNRRVRVRTA